MTAFDKTPSLFDKTATWFDKTTTLFYVFIPPPTQNLAEPSITLVPHFPSRVFSDTNLPMLKYKDNCSLFTLFAALYWLCSIAVLIVFTASFKSVVNILLSLISICACKVTKIILNHLISSYSISVLQLPTKCFGVNP